MEPGVIKKMGKNILTVITLLLLVIIFMPAVSCNNAVDTTHIEGDVLTLATKIGMPGVTGRIDHFAYDSVHQLVFIAALGNNTVEVINIQTGQHVHSITGLHTPQGVYYIASLNRLAVANDGGGDVVFYDCTNYKVIGHTSLKDDADNIRFDEQTNTLYVGYGDGAISIIDVVAMAQTAAIPLDGHPESFQLNKSAGLLYINVPGAGEIQVGDIKTAKVVNTWKNAGASANFPMAFDAGAKRLFIVYRHPAVVKLLSAQTGETMQVIKCSGDADDAFYDKTTGLLFVSCGDGFIDVFKATTDGFVLINHIKTRGGSRTSLWLPSQKNLLLAVPAKWGENAAVWVYHLKG
jgi:DNA-binding beta-propeller fold protein YncE